jgi:uroporphyrinogen decarboxylase
MGGVSEWQTLTEGTPQQVETEVRDAIAQTGGKGFLLGAGCVVPTDVPEANLRAARAAVG